MGTTPLILAFVAAVIIALPPQWCQIITGEKVECCPACADDDCGHEEVPVENENQCQCGITPFKQPETVTTIALCVGDLLPLAVFSQPASIAIVGVIPERNLQQLLCCWRN